MSQTASPQAAPPPPATAATPAAAPGAAAVRQDTGHVDTPALLNRWQLIGMSVAIVFGLLSAFVQFLGWQADGRASADTAQLQRVQEIQSSLLHADALATNAFLVGGLEDPDQRAEYDATIESVLRKIAEAADAQPADQAVLQDLNVAVNGYALAVTDARGNNRQGFPVGAEYLSGASTQIRADAIPILTALVDANTDRAEGSMNGQHPFWLLLIGVVTLAGLFWLNQQLARHFRRRFNKGIAIAAVIVLGVTAVGVLGAWIRDSSNDSLRDGDLELAIGQAGARTAANDAKANESLALIKRGSGAAYVTGWDASAAALDASLEGLDASDRADTEAQWDAYVAVYQQIRKLDDDGDWAGARDLATKSGSGGSSDLLDELDASSADIVAKASDHVVDELDSGRGVALLISALSLLLGVVAAISVSRGIGERRKEFS